MRLRILESNWGPFAEALCARQDVETAGIILAERIAGDLLLGREFTLVPDSGYAIRQPDRIRIDPVGLNRLIRPARDRGLSVFTIHTHPGAREPWFSEADDIGDSVLMPSLFAQTDGPHGSLVVAGDTRIPVARAWQQPGACIGADVQIVGRALRVMPGERAEHPHEWFERQRLALGEHGQQILRRLHVGVCGAGGTGSVTFAQLVHLGVGEITVIDGDMVEASNVSRIIGATIADIGVTAKVEVLTRYAASVGLGTKVNAIRGRLGADVPVRTLEGCDAIFSCVDRHAPRALMNRLSYQKAILLFDMGSAFRVGSEGLIESSGGRVVIAGPGRPCLACWGHIDPNRIRIESLPPEERAREAADGYVSGADVPQPSVIAFNTQIAGMAVVEFLRAVTQFAGACDPPLRLGVDFEAGTVRRNRLAGTRTCSICAVLANCEQ
jgi:molybdopterin/thiamine biosynthesis adenylyltransferase